MSLAHDAPRGQGRPTPPVPVPDGELYEPHGLVPQIRPTASERAFADRLAFVADGGDPENHYLGWQSDGPTDLGRKLLQWEAEEQIEAGLHEAEVAEAGRWYHATLTRGGAL